MPFHVCVTVFNNLCVVCSELMIGETELRKKQRRAKTLKDEYDAKVKEGPREVEISLGSRDEFT